MLAILAVIISGCLDTGSASCFFLGSLILILQIWG